MNNFWKAVIVLSAAIAAAQCLTCRECTIGVLGSCLFQSDVSCNNQTESCYRGDAQFNVTGTISLHTRGCLNRNLCNRTVTSSILGASYTSDFRCCETDLCNGATSVQLPLAVALCAALLSSVWGFSEF
ncbi:lymphocyte antigen 6 complex locus protein G6d-like [Mugil cephalus]|uniref:lymphocyte antigen 6 complex locus protein G6d-like n=1 Tax=Mugil cephalus TaxID=48193 RepID=UPI001FB65FBC|nr:lymphocyte antigen 6 complex locus protein G6d-like [Mugil cephalus]